MKRMFLFAIFILVFVADSASATDAVTSKTYVDHQLDNKQDIIPASGTNSAVSGETVVMYTDSAGVLGERGIFDMETDYVNYAIVSGHENDLLPAEVYGYLEGEMSDAEDVLDQLESAIDQISSDMLTLNDFPQTTASYKTCVSWVESAEHTDANCLLWDLSDRTVFGCHINGDSCSSNSDCCDENCVNSTCVASSNG